MVLIKGMEMPKDCIVCPFGWNGCNNQHDFVYKGIRPDNCPLVPVPEPHGRLIDADALIAEIRANSESYFADDFAHEWVDVAPTIIEAEDGE